MDLPERMRRGIQPIAWVNGHPHEEWILASGTRQWLQKT
jgi:hypothetical protein